MPSVLRLLAAILSLCTFLHAADTPFVFVVPSYNNSAYYQKNLDSIFAQVYPHYRVVFIDDASSDGTGSLVQEYLNTHSLKERVTLIQNAQRMGALANIYKGVSSAAPHEVVVLLDGDDWLFDAHVLEKLNRVYSEEDVWLTYGQFLFFPGDYPGWAAEVPQEVIQNNAFRYHNWTTTHLRSFYAGLFQKIAVEDLMYEGAFFPMAWDLALMWPMLEMAGTHSRFISDYLYVYNFENPLNDYKQDRQLQWDLGLFIRNKERYAPIDQLD